MSSISAVGSQFTSPLQRLQSELSAEISNGTIQSSDQGALSTALTDIDKAMQSQRQSDQASGTRPSPAEMKSKLADLISSEVQNGTITSDQATELQNLFAKAMPSRGHGGHGGGPGGPAVREGRRRARRGRCRRQRRVSTSSTSSTSTTSSTDSDIEKLLADFLKSVRAILKRVERELRRERPQHQRQRRARDGLPELRIARGASGRVLLPLAGEGALASARVG